MIRHRLVSNNLRKISLPHGPILHLFLRLDMLEVDGHIGHFHADDIHDVLFTVRFTSSVVSGMLMPGSMEALIRTPSWLSFSSFTRHLAP